MAMEKIMKNPQGNFMQKLQKFDIIRQRHFMLGNCVGYIERAEFSGIIRAVWYIRNEGSNGIKCIQMQWNKYNVDFVMHTNSAEEAVAVIAAMIRMKI